MAESPLKNYMRKANKARERELGIKNLMANLERYSKMPLGEKNSAHVAASHRMLEIYLNGGN